MNLKKKVFRSFFASAEYRGTLLFLLGELNRLFRKPLLKILISSFIAAGAQVGAIVMIMNTVNILASGGDVRMYGIELKLEPSLSLVIGLAGLVVALISASTVSMYYSRKQTARMMIDYHNHLEKGVLRGVAHLARLPDGSPERELLEPLELASMIGKDGRFAGRVTNEVASSAFPFAAVVIIVPILLYLDYALFAVLGLILASSLAIYGWVGRKGAGVSIALEQRGPQASRAKMSVLRSVQTLGPQNAELDAINDRLRKDPDVLGFEQAYADRLTMPQLGNAVGSMFLAITSFIVLVYFGTRILGGTWEQAGGLLFILLFVYVLISIRNLGRSLTNVNIFYPHLRRIIQFILRTEAPREVEGIEDFSAELATVSATLGARWGYVSSVRYPDYSLVRSQLATALKQYAHLENPVGLLGSLSIAPINLDAGAGQLIAVRLLLNEPALRSWLESNAPVPGESELRPFLELVAEGGFSDQAWDELGVDTKQSLSVILATLEQAEVTALPLVHLASFSDEQIEQLYRQLNGIVVIYWPKNSSLFKKLKIDKVVTFVEPTPHLDPPGKKRKSKKRNLDPAGNGPPISDADADADEVLGVGL